MRPEVVFGDFEGRSVGLQRLLISLKVLFLNSYVVKGDSESADTPLKFELADGDVVLKIVLVLLVALGHGFLGVFKRAIVSTLREDLTLRLVIRQLIG